MQGSFSFWENTPGPTLVSRISVKARISVQGGILTKISVQGGILIKILECWVKTGNFNHNKRDS